MNTRRAGFTLMEVLLALSVSAIVLAAMGGVFFSAIRLRERTLEAVDRSVPLYRALGLLRQDLKGALPPTGYLAGDFRILPGGSGAAIGDGLQFSTTTGVISDGQPWGDTQEVLWELRDPALPARNNGKDLVRSVSRNLLTTSTLDADDQVVLSNVEEVQFQFLEGYDWRDTWDTSLYETNLPAAVRIRIQLAVGEHADIRNRQPVELVVPLVIQSRTNQPAAEQQ